MPKFILKLFLLCLALPQPALADADLFPNRSSSGSTRQLSLTNEVWVGDFSQMLERRLIRVLAPHSRTLYFHDKGRERGLTAELVRNFERYINHQYAKQLHKRPITVVIVPTTRDRLIDDLNRGLGDIVAADLTKTPERLDLVDFLVPDDYSISELALVRRGGEVIANVEDLSGKTVHVRPSSSYHASLTALNGRLKSAGKAPVNIVTVPDAIEDEDLMEMLNAGLVGIIIVDDWKADIWAKVLPNITVTDVAVRSAGQSGWVFRKQSPELQTVLRDFYFNDVKKHRLIEQTIVAFNKNIEQIRNNTADQEWQRFADMLKLFEKYGDQYRFDPLMLAAQGFQESQLRQSARGPTGAIGVMQVLPSTGRSLNVGDVRRLEANIHAGAKYLDDLMARYFSDIEFRDDDRTLFAFASYNAGPGAITRLRHEAEKRGFDPNRWFNNLELVVADKIGWETTTYVRNIYKYYAAYKLQLAIQQHQQQTREQFIP
ncbi:transporter substrate-binding domain-containing protein [Methylomonas sp. LWB]|uniref:transglycosylase SLT domain-containing protein n=1 Tax=Methylomonas sp. LWB TaxID=1905845 RepID=UPI0009F5ECC9|nr:transporter substrate-binding domain-containing protein [Methylomonas sp. LWB]